MMKNLWRAGLTIGVCVFGTAAIGAADDAPKPKAKASATAKPAAQTAKAKGKLKPVDINSAPKDVMMFMLKIDESLAARIIAGRPYLSKARLLTNHIVTEAEYASLKDRVIARQGPAPR